MPRPTSMRQFLFLLALTAASVTVADSPELVSAARQQTRSTVTYDGSYARIGYPLGDVPANRGVCTDLVIRAYRDIGIDLQVLVHEDMRAHFDLYPRLWALKESRTRTSTIAGFRIYRGFLRAPECRLARQVQPTCQATW